MEIAILLITHYLLLITYYSLLITHYLLTHYLLLITQFISVFVGVLPNAREISSTPQLLSEAID
jgi:hypothetical protein